MRRHIYLVPGLFGFAQFGPFSYFRGVSEALARELSQARFEAEIFECATQPTGSIRCRAERLLRTVVDNGGLEADELYFVGHSTGGLDVRLLVSPQVRLGREGEHARLTQRARGVVTIASPHYGTPLASLCNDLPGGRVLKACSSLAVSPRGRAWLCAFASSLARARGWRSLIGRRVLGGSLLRVIAGVTSRDDDPVWLFLREVAADQRAIIQLTPEALDLFNCAVVDAPRVHYGCVLTMAPVEAPAEPFSRLRALRTHGAFALLRSLAALEARAAYPVLGAEEEAHLSLLGGGRISAHTNDGIVPTLSQIHGTILHAALADHLDIVGQFDNDRRDGDWLRSGVSFGADEFRAAWRAVAHFFHEASVERPRLRLVEPASRGARLTSPARPAPRAEGVPFVDKPVRRERPDRR
jgi:hypothetical protein